MKAFKKYLSLFLALAAVLTLGLTGCTGGKNDVTEAPATSAEAPETDPVPELKENLDLIVNGEPVVRVVRPDASTSDDADVKAAMSIRNELMNYCGQNSVKIDTDWTKDGKHDSEALEILVGNTNYEESVQIAKDLRFGDYAVKAVGNKIVILGNTDVAINYAATVFASLLKSAAVQDETSMQYSVSLKIADVDRTGTKNSVISSLPPYENGTFKASYDPGDNCDEVIIEKTTVDAYRAYVEKLKAEGYKEYTSHDVKDNSFATLYNDKYTLNVGYYANNKNVRIIVEPFSETTLIGLPEDNKYEVVTTSQITMIGLEYQASDGSYSSNGMSILIRLTDGRFIVVDGGFNRDKDAQMLIDQMKAQSKEYSAKTGIKIAAWIITHSHGDHQGMIAKKYSSFKNAGIKVERFLFNFMSDTERNKAINSYLAKGSSNWSSSEGGGWSQVYTAANALGAETVIAHVGQRYYMADLEMEVLYTIESYGPDMVNALNTTSIILKMTFTDPVTKKQTVYMSTGDATGPGFNITQQMYGDFLKSDIVQVAHHGYTTWGTENGTMNAYKKMAPATLLWPQGSHAYPNYVNKSYNAVLWNTDSNPNYKETLVAGTEGTITIFPIPYTVGAAIVTKP